MFWRSNIEFLPGLFMNFLFQLRVFPFRAEANNLFNAGISIFTPSASIEANTGTSGTSIFENNSNVFVSFSFGSKSCFKLKGNISIFAGIINQLHDFGLLNLPHRKLRTPALFR